MARYLNFIQRLGGFIYAHTIITGSSKSWDPVRLQKKHRILAKAGAEHVSMVSKTGCKVDGHFLSAASFMQKMEELGGKRLIFDTEPMRPPIKHYGLEIEGKFICRLVKIAIEEDEIFDENGLPLHPKIIEGIAEGNVKIIPDEKTGQYYVIDQSNLKKFQQEFGNKDELEIPENATIKELPQGMEELEMQNENGFPGIKFDKSSSMCQEAVEIFNGMGIDNTQWCVHETENAFILFPRKDQEKLTDAAHPLYEIPVSASSKGETRGTALLTMDQSAIYEQHYDEILTFIMEGVDVMVYNNPSKGLSTGRADRENINASIEATYQYLKGKGISDEKILAKGLCFGGAPTAWLGRKHPDINIMLDQTPANFYDVAVKRMNTYGKGLSEVDISFLRWLGRLIKDNFIISGLARAIFHGYNVPSDISRNNGHKLLNINVQDEKGEGGDDLVPEHHPMAIIDAMRDNPKKLVKLSLNAGGIHGIGWWSSAESNEAVLQFLKKSALAQSLFH